MGQTAAIEKNFALDVVLSGKIKWVLTPLPYRPKNPVPVDESV